MEKKITLFQLFIKFIKLGAFTFGGGYAMIPLIEREVIKNKWLEHDDLVEIVAIAQSIPGAVAVNMSLFIGFRIRKKIGAIVAVLGCILPSFIIIILIATVFKQFQDNVMVNNALNGILAAVVALILISAIKTAKVALFDAITVIITTVTLVSLLLFSIIPVFFILFGAFLGVLLYYLHPGKVKRVVDKK